MIVLELHAGIVIRFEAMGHVGQRRRMRRPLLPVDCCLEARQKQRREVDAPAAVALADAVLAVHRAAKTRGEAPGARHGTEREHDVNETRPRRS
jgi:hypothetical protein